jgi:hypothetical protein
MRMLDRVSLVAAFFATGSAIQEYSGAQQKMCRCIHAIHK